MQPNILNALHCMCLHAVFGFIARRCLSAAIPCHGGRWLQLRTYNLVGCNTFTFSPDIAAGLFDSPLTLRATGGHLLMFMPLSGLFDAIDFCMCAGQFEADAQENKDQFEDDVDEEEEDFRLTRSF
eukprot:1063951-Pelagomonas_calceolata.AAC.5